MITPSQASIDSPRPGLARTARRFAIVTLAAVFPASALVTHAYAASDPLSDSMSRVVESGWGEAPWGGRYEVSDTSAFSVDGRQGIISVPPGRTRSAAVPTAVSADADIRLTAAIAELPSSGSGVYVAASLRTNGASAYRARLRVAPTGDAFLSVRRHTDSSPAGEEVAVETPLPFPVADGDKVTLRARVSGGDTVAIDVKAWPEPSPEPVVWTVTARDSAADRVTAPGETGLWTYASSRGSSAVVRVDDIRVTLASAAEPPVAGFWFTTDDLTAQFDSWRTTVADGWISTREWDFGDGATESSAKPTHTFDRPGTYPVTLTVTDSAGLTDTVTRLVTVTSAADERLVNSPPRAAFTSDANDLTVSLDGSPSSDTDGSIVGYAWTFGDGTTATGPRATHEYGRAGAYTVRLTVTDDAGATASQSRSVALTAPEATPHVGADLPITYDLSTLRGTIRYVAPGGSDAAPGTKAAPFATLTKAEAASASGDTIVVRGGSYPIADNAVWVDRDDLTIIAYPGEVPLFDGSKSAPTSATTEGSLRWIPYTTIPAGIGEGLSLRDLPEAEFDPSGPIGLAADRGWECVAGPTVYESPRPTAADRDGCSSRQLPKLISGFYPDQVWLSGKPLVQVMDKARLSDGEFFVERNSRSDGQPVASRLYLTSEDAANLGALRVSESTGPFLRIAADRVRVEGIRIFGHSPGWSLYTIEVAQGTRGVALTDIAVDSAAGIAVKVAGAASLASLVRDLSLTRVSLLRSGWSGSVVLYGDGVTFDSSELNDANGHMEFARGPQSGGVKATKTHRMRIVKSNFLRNRGFGAWWDQSSYDTQIASSTFSGNSASAVFYEISHGLTMVNNVLIGSSTDPTLRLAGASDVKLVNNTLVGGKDTIAVLTDARSRTYGPTQRLCSEHAQRYGGSPTYTQDCGFYASELDQARPGAYGAANLTPGMDWYSSVSMMLNNIIANPSSSGQCGAPTPVCVLGYTTWGKGALVELSSIFNPGSRIDGNVYQGSTAAIFRNASKQPGQFSASDVATLRGPSALGSGYYGLDVERSGRSGSDLVRQDGAPTASLAGLHSLAAAVPNDAEVNRYLPIGTRHYGALR